MNPVLIIGGAHIDRKGAMEADYIIGASIPGTIEEVVGGGAFNVAANLSRLGFGVTFISPRADDTNSIKVANAIKPLSISDKPVILKGSTPSYTALIDRHGELVAALADMKLYDNLSIEAFLTDDVTNKLKNCQILITDANLPEDVLTRISKTISDDCHWYAIAVSPAKVKRYLPVIERIDCLAMNMNEAKAITDRSNSSDLSDLRKTLEQLGLRGAIITNGADEIIAYLNGSEHITLRPKAVDDVADVTGAGDATLSGFVSVIETGGGIKQALEFGITAARLTIAIKGAQHPLLTNDLVLKELEQNQ
ncbi:MAG: carbohydrate kinase family protein [Lentilitoribacter sp.]